jgi:hypothetical protein
VRGPPELRELARTLNLLAARIEELLERERGSVARPTACGAASLGGARIVLGFPPLGARDRS